MDKKHYSDSESSDDETEFALFDPNNYNINKPMNGVGYDKTKQRYWYRGSDDKMKYVPVSKYTSKKEACRETCKIYKKIVDKTGNKIGNFKSKISPKKIIKIPGIDIEIPLYESIDNPLVHLDGFVAHLNLKFPEKKISKYSDKLILYSVKNEYGGYVTIRFMKIKDVYDFILVCKQSTVYKQFKQFILDVLEQLRIHGSVKLSKDGTLLKQEFSDNKKENSLKSEFKLIPYNYDEKYKEIVSTSKKKLLSKYTKGNIMYFLLTTIPSSYAVCKIGFTDDYFKRFTELIKEYKCDMYLISAKFVTCEEDERRFHKFVKHKYPELIFDYTLSGSKKTEMYKYHPKLMLDFEDFV